MIMPSLEHDAFSQDPAEGSHISVMPSEVLEHLSPKPNGVYVDCTLGLGGHARSILQKGGATVKLVGIDRDKESLAKAEENLKTFSSQCFFAHNDYRNLDVILKKFGIERVDGILMDLGISSFQLNDPHRGFSFRADGPLDMRMDRDSFISAYDLVNTLSEKELSEILKDFGEERFHHRIAKFLVENRKKYPIQTTKELSDIILRAIPGYHSKEKIHPATRSFQALRIAVNRELESLAQVLDKAIDYLKPNGRLVVIAFHSLEDRIVKDKFKVLGREDILHVLTKKPLRPSLEEEQQNPRARSARLRAAERVS